MAHRHRWAPGEHFLLHHQCIQSLDLMVDSHHLQLLTRDTRLLRHLATIIHHLPRRPTWSLIRSDSKSQLFLGESQCQQPWDINSRRTQMTLLMVWAQVNSQWAHTTQAPCNQLHLNPRYLDSTTKDLYLRFVIQPIDNSTHVLIICSNFLQWCQSLSHSLPHLEPTHGNIITISHPPLQHLSLNLKIVTFAKLAIRHFLDHLVWESIPTRIPEKSHSSVHTKDVGKHSVLEATWKGTSEAATPLRVVPCSTKPEHNITSSDYQKTQKS